MTAVPAGADADPSAPHDALAAFFVARGLRRLREARVPAAELPQPYRQLLDHRQDMTSTLEQFHDEAIRLEVLAKEHHQGRLLREVILRGDRSDRPLELGAIDIHLDRFPAAARRELEIGSMPLGGLLGAYAIPYRSRPAGFLRLAASPALRGRFDLAAETAWLFGRHNLLIDPAGATLAEVVEVLPPTSPRATA